MLLEIEKLKNNILTGMAEYIEDDDESQYNKGNIEECNLLLALYINEVNSSSKSNNYNFILKRTKELVLKLNALNKKCEHTIIETDQREDICKLISMVIKNSGHNIKEDITIEWREW